MSTLRDKPWIFRTYAGHSSAVESNRLYRDNLAKGQTGLSIAFDLPTQTGYDSDHPLARGEVGKVGVAISHIGDMRSLFEEIPVATMNTSMTINATAPWLMALYIAVADEQGAARASLQSPGHLDITGVRSQNDDPGLRKLTANSDHGLNATDVWHLQVHQRDVRMILLELLDCLGSGPGLRDHLHVRFIVDQPGYPIPQQRMIVRGQDSNQPGIAHRTSFFRKNPNRR